RRRRLGGDAVPEGQRPHAAEDLPRRTDPDALAHGPDRPIRVRARGPLHYEQVLCQGWRPRQPRHPHRLRRFRQPGLPRQREISVLTDGQKFGWADDSSLLRWELLANRITEGAFKPRLWVVNLDPQRPADPANWAVQPLRTTRAVASVGREVMFRTTLQLMG